MNPLTVSVQVKWGAVLVLTISITGLTIVFRRQLAQFLKGVVIKKIRIRFLGIEVDLEGLHKVQGQMKSAEILELASGERGGSPQRPSSEVAHRVPRDIIVDSWGSLKQIVFDAAASRGLRLTPDTRTPEAVKRLLHARLLASDFAEWITILYGEGKKVVENPGKVDKKFALLYQDLAKRLVDWMTLSILFPEPVTRDETPRDSTIVGGYPPKPGPGHPFALLIGIEGMVRGQRFLIDREHYRIGRNSDNDLCIKGDDYVSGNHASLTYHKGSLFLSDQGSSNGTFLNEKQVMGTPLIVRRGDRIRVGDAVFQVSDIEEKDDSHPDSSKRTWVS